MQVIIMRHGDAVFQGAERVLSAKGEQEARLTGLKLASAFHITKIFCSSKTRALQTANIVHDLLRGREVPPVQVLNELAPYGNTDLAVDYIESVCDENDTVLLVSHIPQVVCLSTAFCHRELELPTFFTYAPCSGAKCRSGDGAYQQQQKAYAAFPARVSAAISCYPQKEQQQEYGGAASRFVSSL